MSESGNVAFVQEAYDNFTSGNMRELFAKLDPQVDWQIPKIDNVRVTGSWQGVDGVREFFATLAADQEAIAFEPREYVANGSDAVVALGHYRWRVRATNKEFASNFAHVFTLRDGRVTSFREFFNTVAAAEAYRA